MKADGRTLRTPIGDYEGRFPPLFSRPILDWDQDGKEESLNFSRPEISAILN
jgi:hypothetical protein